MSIGQKGMFYAAECMAEEHACDKAGDSECGMG